MMAKKRVIIVTDGDRIARKAVETAAQNVGGRCISTSYGNPTLLPAAEIVDLIHQTPYDPVLVMVDDDGNAHKGKGEKVLEELLNDESIQVLGVVAVASATENVQGVSVQYSITRDGRIIRGAVDKGGEEQVDVPGVLIGDTVDALNYSRVPVVVGIGDPGKMGHHDDWTKGAPVTTKAVEFILKRSSS
ncbi:MAG: stage V sporulation protein AE [Firmicutes bacterium]|nr:stage V sporulation protein AE [Bacillota bacterium]